MSGGAAAGLGVGQQNASNPGVDYGGVSGILQKMDPLGNKITEIGGDPLNIYGHKNNPNALLFPSGTGTTGAIPSVLPNLGANTLIPHAPQGRFMPVNTAGGGFNAMANQGAGPLFNPAAMPAAPAMVRKPPPGHTASQPIDPGMAALIARFLGPNNRLGIQP